MRKLSRVFVCVMTSFLFSFGCANTVKTVPVKSVSGEPQPVVESRLPENKRTDLGLYVTSADAYEQWRLNPDKIKVLDCRTPEEYAFVGHAPMAHNIPSKFFTYKYDAEKEGFVMKDNDNFLAEAEKKLSPEETIFVMCRSGGRSAMTVNKLAKAGYAKVYNIIDGFEGDKVKDAGSYFDGKRMRNGWKNSGAPWTYSLDPKLIYATED